MIMERQPTAYPYLQTGMADMVMFVKSTASAYFGYDEFGIGLYDSDKQEYHPCLEENGPYLTALKFYNTLYQKGLFRSRFPDTGI